MNTGRFKHKVRSVDWSKLILALVAVGVLCAVLLFVFTKTDKTPEVESSLPAADDDSSSAEEDSGVVLYNGNRYVPNESIETFLVMGLDKFEENLDRGGYTNGEQSDFNLLIVMDREHDTCTAVHINRDSMTDVPVIGSAGQVNQTYRGQLALAHAYGSGGSDSCINQANAVSNLLYGVKIDHYAAITMDAVGVISDAVGGVTVDLLQDFTFVNPEYTQGTTVTLTGSEALTYVRARMQLEGGSNLDRMERQRQFMTALWAKVKEKSDSNPSFLLDLLLNISSDLTSDCSNNQLAELFDSLGNLNMDEIRTLPGEAVMGEEFMEYHVDETAVQDLVVELFYDPAPETGTESE